MKQKFLLIISICSIILMSGCAHNRVLSSDCQTNRTNYKCNHQDYNYQYQHISSTRAVNYGIIDNDSW